MRLPTVAAALLIATVTLEPSTEGCGQPADGGRPRRATLASLRDRYRPLLVFAPTGKDARLLKQAQYFAGGDSEMHQRQVLLVQLTLNKQGTKAQLNGADEAELSKEEAVAARRRFHIAPAEFAVILIGKDGDEKFRAQTPVTIERLNAVIDAMPMRQQEVRNGNSK